MSSLLLDNVSVSFAGVRAVDGVTIEVPAGAVVGLVGPNGSGKTTVVNVASGTIAPGSGRITVNGHELTGRRPDRYAARGVIRTFQALRLFEGLSVIENVLVGAQRGARLSAATAILRLPRFRSRERELRAVAVGLLDRLELGALADRRVASLSHGQRRRVELARALASAPKYLVLDEPGAGVARGQLREVGALVRDVAATGVGILVVEHDTELLDQISDTVVGMLAGRIVAAGSLPDVVAHELLAPHLSPRVER